MIFNRGPLSSIQARPIFNGDGFPEGVHVGALAPTLNKKGRSAPGNPFPALISYLGLVIIKIRH